MAGQFVYKQQWLIGSWLQGERYYVPVLGAARRDIVGSLQVVFTPRNWAVGR